MILTTLLAAAALYGGPTSVLAPQTTSKETAEGVEILRRLLVESLDKAFESETKREQVTVQGLPVQRLGGLVTTLWAGAGTVEQARAFHLPEVGLFFALDLSLPVVAAEKEPAPGAEKGATGDEWERTRRQLRGDSELEGAFAFQRLRVTGMPAAEIDPQAIEKVIDLALRTIARHADRIEGLGANDTATLALRLSGKTRTLFEDYAPEELDLHAKTPDEPEAPATTRSFSAYVMATGHDVREQHLVIRVPLADLAALADSAPRLRQRAQINLY